MAHLPNIRDLLTLIVTRRRLVSWTVRISAGGTYGISPGSEPSFGFSLLWTTNTANLVFASSRSWWGNNFTALSASF